mmetsp:Transcript_64778/g.88966  ORF Transcript_64778/g.88966 Transcript_64778/m.88966 type:complete len:211 (-) Transcript_64778:1677-2309(-)
MLRGTVRLQSHHGVVQACVDAIRQQLLDPDRRILGQHVLSDLALVRLRPELLPVPVFRVDVQGGVRVAHLHEPRCVVPRHEVRLVRLLHPLLEHPLPLGQLPRLVPALPVHRAVYCRLNLLRFPEDLSGGFVTADVPQAARDLHDHLGVPHTALCPGHSHRTLPYFFKLIWRQHILASVEVRIDRVRPLLGVLPHAAVREEVCLRPAGAP